MTFIDQPIRNCHFLNFVVNCGHHLITDASFIFRLVLHGLVEFSLVFHHNSDLVAQ